MIFHFFLSICMRFVDDLGSYWGSFRDAPNKKQQHNATQHHTNHNPARNNTGLRLARWRLLAAGIGYIYIYIYTHIYIYIYIYIRIRIRILFFLSLSDEACVVLCLRRLAADVYSSSNASCPSRKHLCTWRWALKEGTTSRSTSAGISTSGNSL